jgi:hypothetical protein
VRHEGKVQGEAGRVVESRLRRDGVESGLWPDFSSRMAPMLLPIHPMRPFFGILLISTKLLDMIILPQPMLNHLIFLNFAKNQRKRLSINNLQQICPVSN